MSSLGQAESLTFSVSSLATPGVIFHDTVLTGTGCTSSVGARTGVAGRRQVGGSPEYLNPQYPRQTAGNQQRTGNERTLWVALPM